MLLIIKLFTFLIALNNYIKEYVIVINYFYFIIIKKISFI